MPDWEATAPTAICYLRFKKGDGPFDWDETIGKMHASVKKMDTTKVNKEDLARMGGAPAESDE